MELANRCMNSNPLARPSAFGMYCELDKLFDLLVSSDVLLPPLSKSTLSHEALEFEQADEIIPTLSVKREIHPQAIYSSRLINSKVKTSIIVQSSAEDKFVRERSEIYGICLHCKRFCTNFGWCQSCDPIIINQGLMSGNRELDNFIKAIQHSVTSYGKVIEWIPFSKFKDIKMVGEGGFSKVYSATWIGGVRPEFKSEKRHNEMCTVALKSLKSDSNQFLQEELEKLYRILFGESKLNQEELAVKKEFDKADEIIPTLSIESETHPQAVYTSRLMNFSDVLSCEGAASPSRAIPLQDNDGTIRYYPQALVKQMQFPAHPEFETYDITALFSSSANLFFKGDSAIQLDQYDFEYIVTHDYLPEVLALTPYPQFLDDITDVNQPVTYTGFVEMAFDGYILLTDFGDTVKMTTLAQRIDHFTSTGEKFTSVDSFSNAFVSSSQYAIGNNLLVAAQTPYTMKFVTNGSSSVFLETKLIFTAGSSITHVDTAYSSTPDFLMVYKAEQGISLDELIKINGNAPGGAIGPNLTKIMETLGYATPDNPSPYRPTLPKSNTATKNLHPSPSMPIGLIVIIIYLLI
ncbi:10723_t:CDS:2 [Acaulospora colombiana]|uniref:10723_t:CDS:1 n=1 Tax=Acaulospora colombiana TaxID=27376 RepID=A0ACA9JWN1_9GLOM|nr:10723_t:CDS:2 [Acaulospora colombiana]